MGSTTIRVSDKTHRVLQELASAIGAPMSDVVDQALELYRRQRMFAQANAAYAALRADSIASAEWDAELAAWDATLADGLEEY
jgi:predicted transcriptional regulator